MTDIEPKRKRVCIIAHYFPPLNHIASKRPYFLAYYLSKMGYQVCVLTTTKIPLYGYIGEYPDINFELVEVPNILFDKINKIFEMKKRIMKKNEKSVVNKDRNLNIDMLLRFKEIRDIFLKTFGPNFDIMIPWITPAVLYLIRRIHEKDKLFDVIISTFPPVSVHITAGIIKRLFPSVKWIADYRDLWSHDLHFSNKLSAKVSEPIEKFFISKADYITTVSEALRKSLENMLGKDVKLIRNSFGEKKLARAGKIYKEKTKREKVKNFVYTGAFYPRRIDPKNFFKGISIPKGKHLNLKNLMKVEIYGVPNMPIEQMIKELNIEDIVQYRGIVDINESLKIQEEADYLLFFNLTEIENETEKGIITGKIYEYITAGTPIISIGKVEDSEANQIIKETGTGIFVKNEPEEIAKILEKIVIEDQDIPFSPNIDKILEFSSVKMAEKFAELIEH